MSGVLEAVDRLRRGGHLVLHRLGGRWVVTLAVRHGRELGFLRPTPGQ